MGRARITLKCIENERARKTTFERRSKGLLKKVSDFTTLCGAEACLIVYSRDDSDAPPMTWPNDPKMVHSFLEKYEGLKNEKPPKKFELEDFIDKRIDMHEAKITRMKKDILKIKYPPMDPCFSKMGEEQLRDFISFMDAKIEACNHRINMLTNKPT